MVPQTWAVDLFFHKRSVIGIIISVTNLKSAFFYPWMNFVHDMPTLLLVRQVSCLFTNSCSYCSAHFHFQSKPWSYDLFAFTLPPAHYRNFPYMSISHLLFLCINTTLPEGGVPQVHPCTNTSCTLAHHHAAWCILHNNTVAFLYPLCKQEVTQSFGILLSFSYYMCA